MLKELKKINNNFENYIGSLKTYNMLVNKKIFKSTYINELRNHEYYC